MADMTVEQAHRAGTRWLQEGQLTGFQQHVLEVLLAATDPAKCAVPEGWMRVIDEAMVVHHAGVADATDSYEVAKQKMNLLLSLAQDIGALHAVPQWQPIETAPKNATDILLFGVPHWNERPRAYVGHWASDLSGEEQPPFKGWFRQVGAGFQEVPKPPTHWMPLPTAPQPTSKENKT